MASSMGAAMAQVTDPSPEDARKYVLDKYETKIAYYWTTSRNNKRSYKSTRFLVVLLGALVTLVASLSSSSFVGKLPVISLLFAIATPVLAALLAVVAGVSQAFQWGAAWSDGVITATRLEKERDRIAVTPLNEFDPLKEIALLDETLLAETQGFFQRLLGSGGPSKSQPQPGPGK